MIITMGFLCCSVRKKKHKLISGFHSEAPETDVKMAFLSYYYVGLLSRSVHSETFPRHWSYESHRKRGGWGALEIKNRMIVSELKT